MESKIAIFPSLFKPNPSAIKLKKNHPPMLNSVGNTRVGYLLIIHPSSLLDLGY